MLKCVASMGRSDKGATRQMSSGALAVETYGVEETERSGSSEEYIEASQDLIGNDEFAVRPKFH